MEFIERREKSKFDFCGDYLVSLNSDNQLKLEEFGSKNKIVNIQLPEDVYSGIVIHDNSILV